MTLIFHKLIKWILLVILFCAGPLWASIGNVDKLEGKGVIDRNKTDITLEDIWKNYSFYPKGYGGLNSMNDGEHYVNMENKK